jgi:PAS domain S-box-containing protein
MTEAAMPLSDDAGRVSSRKTKKELLEELAEARGRIAGLEQMEEALRESEVRFRAVVENSPNQIYLKDPEGRYLLVNKIYAETMGLSVEEAIGKTARDWVPERSAETYFAHDREVIESGEAVTREIEVPLADGSILTHLATKFPIFGAEGRIAATGGIGVDITERKRAEEEGHERGALLTHAAAIAGLGHWVWDEVEHRTVSCSEQLAQISGLSSPEAYVTATQSYEAVRALIHPDDRVRYGVHLRSAHRDRPQLEIEYRIVRRDGEVRHVRELSEPILDEAGQLIRTFGTNQDITEMKHAGEALRESEARLKQAQDIARIGSFLWDEVKDEAIYRSDVIHDIYCLSPEETPHAFEDLLKLYHPDDRGRIGESYTAAAAAGEPYDIEYRVIRPDGEIRRVRGQQRPLDLVLRSGRQRGPESSE